MIFGYKPPVTAVFRVMAVVTHHPIILFECVVFNDSTNLISFPILRSFYLRYHSIHSQLWFFCKMVMIPR
jgi:hypothetical protein